jgi:hypothetical protein
LVYLSLSCHLIVQYYNLHVHGAVAPVSILAAITASLCSDYKD